MEGDGTRLRHECFARGPFGWRLGVTMSGVLEGCVADQQLVCCRRLGGTGSGGPTRYTCAAD